MGGIYYEHFNLSGGMNMNIHYARQGELEAAISTFDKSARTEEDYLKLFLEVRRAFAQGIGLGGEQITNAIKNAIADRNVVKHKARCIKNLHNERGQLLAKKGNEYSFQLKTIPKMHMVLDDDYSTKPEFNVELFRQHFTYDTEVVHYPVGTWLWPTQD